MNKPNQSWFIAIWLFTIEIIEHPQNIALWEKNTKTVQTMEQS